MDVIELGNHAPGKILHFMWPTYSQSSGARLTRTTPGTIKVYKDNGTTEITAGVTDTVDFDAITGIQHTRIDTGADAAYVAGSQYHVVIDGMVVNAQTMSRVLARFTLGEEEKVDVAKIDGDATAAANLKQSCKTMVDGTVQAGTLTTTQFTSNITTLNADRPVGRQVIFESGANKGLAVTVQDYDPTGGLFTVTQMPVAPAANDRFVVV